METEPLIIDSASYFFVLVMICIDEMSLWYHNYFIFFILLTQVIIHKPKINRKSQGVCFPVIAREVCDLVVFNINTIIFFNHQLEIG